MKELRCQEQQQQPWVQPWGQPQQRMSIQVLLFIVFNLSQESLLILFTLLGLAIVTNPIYFSSPFVSSSNSSPGFSPGVSSSRSSE
jgi:hypothetical protein